MKVRNDPAAVSERLRYLRVTANCDTRRLEEHEYLLPKAAEELPRQIKFEVTDQGYYLLHDYTDIYHYLEDELALGDYLTADGYPRGTDSATVEKALRDMRDQTNAAVYPDTRNESTIIPLTVLSGDDMVTAVPKEAGDILGLTPEGRSVIHRRQLYRNLCASTSWLYPDSTNTKLAESIAADGVSEKYLYGECVAVKLTINGIPADKSNLTLSERFDVIDMITDGHLHGHIISDGREDEKKVREMYFDDKEMPTFTEDEMHDNLYDMYGFRNIAADKIRAYQEAQRAEQSAQEQVTTEKKPKRHFFR